MKETLLLPRLGETMEFGRVNLWLKKPGDAFQRGETIVEIESDKTVVELPALEAGWIEEILASEGSDVAVGHPLCIYKKADNAIKKQLLPNPSAKTIDQEEERLERSSKSHTTDINSTASIPLAKGCRATPKARSAARTAGIKLTSIQGTGRRGRIETKDIINFNNDFVSELNFQTWGKSESSKFVLLHGYGGDLKTWSGLATRLSHHGAEVLALDLPGHGATKLEVNNIDDLINPVVLWLQKQDKKKIDLVGHSLGGFVATMAANAVKQAVRSLTLIAPVGLGPEINHDFTDKMSTIQHTGALAHLLRRLTTEPMAFDEAQLSKILKTNSGRIEKLAGIIAGPEGQRLDLITTLTNLDLPVRIIWGKEDSIIPWLHAANLPSHIPIHFIRGAGHMAHWDRPDSISNLIFKNM